MKRSLILILAGSLLLAGCGVLTWQDTAPGMSVGGVWDNTYSSNGERIYFTGTNNRGERISYSGGIPFGGGMMMGSTLACVSCHGSDGRGGLHPMHMQVMDAPDITYDALTGEGEEHAEEELEEDGHADEHEGYSLDDFRRAVVEGEHPDGDPLDRDMPSWRMSDRDLADLYEFLKELP